MFINWELQNQSSNKDFRYYSYKSTAFILIRIFFYSHDKVSCLTYGCLQILGYKNAFNFPHLDTTLGDSLREISDEKSFHVIFFFCDNEYIQINENLETPYLSSGEEVDYVSEKFVGLTTSSNNKY